MARGGSVQVRDLGWRDIKTKVRGLHGRGVKVGYRAGSGSNDGVDVVDYATFLEFGTSKMPARPFMRHTADANRRQVGAVARRFASEVALGRMSVDAALGGLGSWYRGLIQDTITNARGWAAPLSPVTIRLKGSSAPLIDKGILRNTVDYEKE